MIFPRSIGSALLCAVFGILILFSSSVMAQTGPPPPPADERAGFSDFVRNVLIPPPVQAGIWVFGKNDDDKTQIVIDIYERFVSNGQDKVAGCMACGLVSTFASVGDAYAKSVFVYLAAGVRPILAMLFGLYVILQVAKMANPFGSPVSSLKNIALTTVKLAVIYIALSPPVAIDGSPVKKQPFIDLVYMPAFELSTSVGSYALGTILGDVNDDFAKFVDPTSDGDLAAVYPNSLEVILFQTYARYGETVQFGNGERVTYDKGITDLRLLSDDDLHPLNAFVFNSQKIIATGVAFSVLQLVLLPEGLGFIDKVKGIGKLLVTSLVLAVLLAAFGLAYITVGLYLVDLVVRMMVITALMPLCLIGQVVPVPFLAGAFNESIKTYVSAFMTFLLGAVIFGITGFMIVALPEFMGFSGTRDMIEKSMAEGGRFSIFDISFWIMAMGCTIMLKAMTTASSVVQSLSLSSAGDAISGGGGASSNIMKKGVTATAALAAGAATGGTTVAIAAGSKAASMSGGKG